jgi:type VI secretion system protein ImpJ
MLPQHLQAQDRYHEELLSTWLGTLHPFSWGIVSVRLDAEALKAGQLQLEHFAGVLPDGLVLELRRGEPEAPVARSLEEPMRASRSVDVYLGVPKAREGGNYDTGDGAGRARFTAVEQPVSDQANADSIEQVSFAQRNVKLLLENELDDHEVIKIAEVVRGSNGLLALDRTYVPPCRWVSTSPHLVDGLQRLYGHLLAKQHALAESRRHLASGQQEVTLDYVLQLEQLKVVNGMIPVVKHALDFKHVDPREVYRELVRCAGELFTFDPSGDDPTVLPEYVFQNLRGTFKDLFERLDELLGMVGVSQCVTVRLESRSDGMHVGRLEDKRLEQCSRFLLAVSAPQGVPEGMVWNLVPKLAKVGTREQLKGLLGTATSGIPLQSTPKPPPQVPMKPGVSYFTLGANDARWKDVMRGAALAVHLPLPFEPGQTQVELLAVLPTDVAAASTQAPPPRPSTTS